MILDEIVKHKREEVNRAKARLPPESLESAVKKAAAVRPFARSLQAPGRFRVIAELKKASPSGGMLCSVYEPESLARSYESHGAAALSVLTDENYFQGCLEDLQEARKATMLPVLRKDFTIDSYQIFEARAAGADCILLIVRILGLQELKDFQALARDLGMDALVETHSEEDVDAALEAGANLIGINNRNLDTLAVNLETTQRLRKRIPSGPTVVSESGIKSAEDVRRLRAWGVDAALVGESLIRSADPGAALAALIQ